MTAKLGTWLVASAAAVSASLLALAVLVLAGVLVAIRPQPFDPLQYPPQFVTDTVDGVPGAAVRLGADVHVEARKCNTSGHPVQVRGAVSWQSVDPAGTTVEVGTSVGIRPPGCITRSFANPMPAAVVARSLDLFATGYSRVVWIVQGDETPLAHAGAVSRSWATNLVSVVPA